MHPDDDFFADADAPEAQQGRERDVDTNGAGPPAARTAPPARGAVSNLHDALTGAAQPAAQRAGHADRPPAAGALAELGGAASAPKTLAWRDCRAHRVRT